MPSVNPDEWRRPGPTAGQRRTDVWTGLAVAAVALLNLFIVRHAGFIDSADVAPLPEQICWVLAITLPLTVRRRYPDVTAVLIAAAFIGAQARGSQEAQVTIGVLFASIYTLGAWGRHRGRSRLLRLAIIGAMFAWLAAAFVIHGGGSVAPAVKASVAFNTFVVNAAFFAFCYLMGDAVWRGVRHGHELEEQTAELRAAHTAAAERAVLGERVRIARELHDVVAHHVSVMGIQASACRRAMDKDPARARTALTAVEESARTAVDELRRMLGALRASGAPEAGSPAGIDRLPEIAERAEEAGLAVRYAVYGDPVPLPDSLSQAAYRIVQEAVTNTLKHAGASTVDVRVRYLSGQIELDVTDDGRGGAAGGGGLGVIGMRERVAVHDGTLEHGPQPNGGYRVRARIPYPAKVVS
ncbi:two-component sensor histidine kinase [Actinoplanes lobatus]|uniref:histidine kinase n=1 Tax=Actinoplanes lobatus TaxID=113568 RepID=A0A7W7HAT1_9ACTN|nr:sensor histidine kinase [Actinoplanes lobatus]MBB4746662.1 signal transduction histidine kinase [Actinoplanes lobatus]GGN53485.1 two-component sensor histidine kinase [Actinoplanes lobatus]GIE38728.1 two-component sensor histidine kinase [Actinoplanes lobatus]